MPKETKKFINPLLRPSQGNAEPRPVTPSVESVESVSADLPPPSAEIPIEAVVSEVGERQEPLQRSNAVPETITETAPAPAPSIPYSQESTVEKSAARESRETTRKSRTASPSRSPIPERVPEQDARDDDDDIAYPASEPLVVSARRNTEKPVSGSRAIARPTTEARIGVSTPTRAATSSANDADISDENMPRRSVRTSGTSDGEERSVPRRRRHVQSFESTHERITLWIASDLKQDFEDLALTRNTSKTALLDEAIADLLHKHRG